MGLKFLKGVNVMLKAAKKNRVLQIPDEKVEEYMKMGYTIRDLEGNTIWKPENEKEEAEQLRKENGELKAQLEEACEYAETKDKMIGALEEENTKLKTQIAGLKAKLKEAEAIPVKDGTAAAVLAEDGKGKKKAAGKKEG